MIAFCLGLAAYAIDGCKPVHAPGMPSAVQDSSAVGGSTPIAPLTVASSDLQIGSILQIKGQLLSTTVITNWASSSLVPFPVQSIQEEPVPRADIRLLDAAGKQLHLTTTDASGDFTFINLDPSTALETVQANFQADGQSYLEQAFAIPAPDPAPVVVDAASSLVVWKIQRLQQHGDLQNIYFDKLAPIADAIKASGQDIATGSLVSQDAGVAAFDALYETLLLAKDGTLASRLSDALVPGQPGPGVFSVTLTAPLGGTLDTDVTAAGESGIDVSMDKEGVANGAPGIDVFITDGASGSGLAGGHQ